MGRADIDSHFEEEPPPDFLIYLQRRLGTSRETALKVLGHWLSTYEPRTRRVIKVQTREPCTMDPGSERAA